MRHINDSNEYERLVDKHAIILLGELATNICRLHNIKVKWKNRAREGLLPDPSRIAAFEGIENMLLEHADKLEVFFPMDKASGKLARIPTRSFEEVIELTDGLESIHRSLEIIERSYWQRLEGYYPPAVDSMIRGGSVSESGSIHQIFNAADIVCSSYWDSIFKNPRKWPWRGLTVFGRFHEFMYWNELILAPEYVKVRSTPTWIYFSHEVAHQAVPKLMQNAKFAGIYQDLVRIFSNFPSLIGWHSSATYLANETIADMLATLTSGEQYILALTNLKYYPSFTIFSRQQLAARRIRYPVRLRVLLCSWTICLAWGLGESIETSTGEVPESRILLQAIDNAAREDALSKKRVEYHLGKTDEELERMALWAYPVERIRKYLEAISTHLDALDNELIPNIVKRVLERKIPQRIKAFVKQDFYHTDPSIYYYNFDVSQLTRQTVSGLCTEACVKTSDSNRIDMNKRNRNKLLKEMVRDFQRFHLITQEPRDVLASLGRLVLQIGRSGDEWSHLCLCSIFARTQ